MSELYKAETHAGPVVVSKKGKIALISRAKLAVSVNEADGIQEIVKKAASSKRGLVLTQVVKRNTDPGSFHGATLIRFV